MSRAGLWATDPAQAYRAVAGALCSAGPALLFGLRLWAAVCLALYIAFWLQLDNAYWAGTSAALVCQPHLGASLRKGWYRMIGTLVGAVAIVVMTACFPQDRAAFLVCLALWGAACALVAAPRRLVELFAALSAEIAGRFTGTLAQGGSELARTQSVRRELVRRVIALDPVIDEVIGESSRLRHHSPVLQAAVAGLFAALAGWRTVAVRLARLPEGAARREADVVLQHVPKEFRSPLDKGEATRWMSAPIRLRRLCDAAVRALIDLPASTPSLRLLADQTAKALAGMSHALEGLALLVAEI